MTECFALVELYTGDGLEMAGYPAVPLRKLCTITVDSYNGLEMYVSVYNWMKFQYYR